MGGGIDSAVCCGSVDGYGDMGYTSKAKVGYERKGRPDRQPIIRVTGLEFALRVD